MNARRLENQMTSLSRTILALAILAQSAMAFAQEGTVSGLEVVELDDATEIRIQAFDNASYSVYRLRNPLRLFIDVSGASIDGDVAPVSIENGVLSTVAATQYEDEFASVSRVVLGFEQDALYDVVAEGDELVVTVDGAGRNLFVAGGPQDAEDFALLRQELAAAQGRVVALEEAVSVARSNAQSAEVELLDQHLARETAERDRLAALANVADVSAENDDLRAEVQATTARFEAEAAGRVRAETALAQQQDALARVEAERAAALERIDSLSESADANQAAIDARDAEIAGLQATIAELDARVAAGDATPSVTAQLQAQQAALAARQAEYDQLVAEAATTRQSLEAALSEARATQEEQQALIAQQAATIAEMQAAAPVADAAGGEITDIRFEHDAGVDRIIIEAPSADFAALPAEAGRSALVFSGTALPDRLRRTLDTQAFQGPVSFVSSYTDTDGEVRVVAELNGVTSEVLRQENGRVVWEFAPVADATAAAATDDAALATSYGSTSSPYAVASGGASQGGNPFLRRPQMTRKRITIDLRDADIQNVLRLIADEGNINIIAGAGVSGSITLRLRSVPLDDALMVILESRDLGWEQHGNIIRVAPLADLEERYNAELELLANEWRLEPLRVDLIPLSYASASTVAPLVEGVLSSRGRVDVDGRNNTLIVTDVQAHIETAAALVGRVDTQTPQILIEARIVETNDSFRRQLGIQWGFDFLADQSLGNATGLLFPSTIGVAGGASDGQEPTAGTSSTPNFAVNLPAPAGTGSGGAVGFTFGSLSGAFNLNLRLSAAEDTGTAKVVSAPRIMTLDNTPATINSGVSIPVSVVSAAGAQTVFFDASLTLTVLPSTTPDGNVFLDVSITKNEPDFENTGARGDPSIITRTATTQLLVADGDTTVIGGIFQRNSGYSTSRVPFFGHLPIIGALFRNNSQTDVRNELLVFITPRIVNREAAIDTLTSGDQITTEQR